MIKLLIVDDSALIRKLFTLVFKAQPDFEIALAKNGRHALEMLESFAPDVVTLDVNMPEMDGIACLDQIMLKRPCPVVMVSSLTAQAADETLEALRLGAVDFVPKPEGAVSLHIDELAPELVAKVRAAAGAKLSASLRLKERVRHRIGAKTTPAKAPREEKVEGDGLVLIGCSTGGPYALEAVLSALPANFPHPILIAQHMPANFTGPLARRLNDMCAVEVREVSRAIPLRAGHAYIGRGDADLVVARRPAGIVAMAAPARANYPWHPSVDRLVRSALDVVPPAQLIGVLMTGMGNDGAEAMALLHQRGGRSIAEAEETAVVWGMPGELVKADGADFVLPLPAIAERIVKWAP